MAKGIDISGQTFGYLKVKHKTETTSPRGGKLWECECRCGATVYATAGDLRNGKRKSCGCMARGPLPDRKEYPPATECVYCKKNRCDILTEMLCVTKYTCGHWDPRKDETGRILW